MPQEMSVAYPNLNMTVERIDAQIVASLCNQWSFFLTTFATLILLFYLADLLLSRSRYREHDFVRSYPRGMIDSLTIFLCVVIVCLAWF
jgi:hypothetical protein